MALSGKATGSLTESWNDAPEKRGTRTEESEDGQSGKMRRGFAAFLYLRPWEKIFLGAAVV